MNDPGDALLVGVLVGGGGKRLGGVAKGLLQAPDGSGTLVARLLDEVRAALPTAAVVLVGAGYGYDTLSTPRIADAPDCPGPLGGLLALLQHAEREGYERVLALACDLPFITRGVVSRLCQVAPTAHAVVTQQGGVRNPLIARYAVTQALAATEAVRQSGKRSLQAVLDGLGSAVTSLTLSRDEERLLRDWDTPDDVENA